MLVTEPGIVTDVRLLQPSNASSPMLVTERGITTFPLTPEINVFPSFDKRRLLTEV